MDIERSLRWSLLATAVVALLGAGALLTAHWHEEQIVLARFDAGYQIGVSEACWDLAQGTARHYVMGDRPLHQDIDPASGLPNRAIAGCLVTHGDEGRAAGYNDTVAVWRARHAAATGGAAPVVK